MLVVSGCATTDDKNQEMMLQSNRVDEQLVQSARAIQESIRVMREMRNYIAQHAKSDEERRAAALAREKVPKGTDRPLILNTDGGVIETVKLLAGLSNYHFEVVGVPVNRPIVLRANGRMIIDALYDLDGQVMEVARVCIYPTQGDTDINGMITVNFTKQC